MYQTHINSCSPPALDMSTMVHFNVMHDSTFGPIGDKLLGRVEITVGELCKCQEELQELGEYLVLE